MISEFKLERFYAQYEFSARYMFSSSDCESLTLAELLAMADPTERQVWDALSLGYTESQGWPRLRQAVSGLYGRILPEQVMIAAPEEAIFVAMHSLLAPGDELVVLTPTYQSLYEIARSIGCRVIEWPLQLELTGWKLDLNRLADLVTDRTRLLVVNAPNNPTGHLPSAGEWSQVIAVARSHNVVVFADEMYRGLEPKDELRLPTMCDSYELGISLSGLSKTYALPGLRMGWLACRNADWLARFQQMKDYTTICSSAPSEVLAWIALRNRERIRLRNLDIIRINSALARETFMQYPDLVEWIPPVAGSIAFPRWLGKVLIEDFCREVVDESGVMIVPGSMFDSTGSHFRVGLGRLNFSEALNLVEKNHLSRFKAGKIRSIVTNCINEEEQE